MLMNVPRAAAVMSRERLDGVIGASPENVAYLTYFFDPNLWMFRGTQAYALFEAGAVESTWLILPRGDLDLSAAAPPRAGQIVSYGSFYYGPTAPVDLNPFEQRLVALTTDVAKPSALDALAGVLAESRMRRIGIDERAIAPTILEGVRAKLPDRDLVPASHLFLEIRASKTQEEVNRLAAATRITEEAMYACLKGVRAGVTERELAEEFEVALVRRGARPLFSIIAFGRWAAAPNRPAGLSTLAPGDLIRFDIGCMFEGYCSDISRTFSFGPPSEKLALAYRAILEGEGTALQAVRAGVKACDVFEAGVEAVRRNGLPHYARHHIGHGIGLELYEPPLIGPGTAQPLEAGMVLEVETPYYEPGFGGIQVEDTVVVTATGYEMLTSRDRELVRVA